jgi:hypothetical protein
MAPDLVWSDRRHWNFGHSEIGTFDRPPRTPSGDGMRGSSAPGITSNGFVILDTSAIGEISANTACIAGSRSSPYSARRLSRR